MSDLEDDECGTCEAPLCEALTKYCCECENLQCDECCFCCDRCMHSVCICCAVICHKCDKYICMHCQKYCEIHMDLMKICFTCMDGICKSKNSPTCGTCDRVLCRGSYETRFKLAKKCMGCGIYFCGTCKKFPHKCGQM